jgi:hypothetical protein
MGVVRLPAGRLRASERSGLRRVLGQGRAVAVPVRPLHVVTNSAAERSAFCAGCAAPIEFGAVMRGVDSYCSVECSLGGGHPA